MRFCAMLFDLISQGANPLSAIALSIIAFVFGFMIAAIIFMDDKV